MKKRLSGIGASNGVAVGKAFLLQTPQFCFDQIQFQGQQQELANYHQTKKTAIEQLQEIIAITTKQLSVEKAAVFQAHIFMVEDQELNDQIEQQISNHVPLAIAIRDTYQQFINQFQGLNDQYFKERVADLIDVQNRLLAIVFHQPLPDLLRINKPCIIVAHDLTPSETVQLNPKFVKGFVTNIGGSTSHAAIMARTLEIPAVLSVENITTFVQTNQVIGIDGTTGDVEIIVNDQQQKFWLEKQSSFHLYQQELANYKLVSPITTDQHQVLVEGNIGNHLDVNKVIANGGEGIGLFRSEFLYMNNNNWPDEETQLASYQTVLQQMPKHLVIIRTLDIGGDKNLSYYHFPKEMNPFLGYRALRLCLDQPAIFKTQLRALLRASIYGKLGIMFPMVTTVEEFLKAKALTLAVAKELKKEGYLVSNDYLIGMMIEVPTAAVLASTFAKHADFFSIGSNDLIQYSMAVDRMSNQVNYLYQPNFPGLLKMIKLAIEGAQSYNKPIGMCGEMASDLKSIPILLGLKLNAFSMSAGAIPAAKRLISKLNYQECVQLANQALLLETTKEVNQLVTTFLTKRNIQI